MRTIPIILLSFAFVLAGCATTDPSGTFSGQEPTETPSATLPASEPAPSPTPTTQPSPDPSEPEPQAPPLRLTYGVLGGNTTTANETHYYVNVTLPIPVSLSLDGTEFDTRTVEGNHTWELPLDPGQTPFEARIMAPEGTIRDVHNLVRLAATTFIVDYCHYHPDGPAGKVDEYTTWIDVDARPSADMYENRSRPDTFTAHDQMESWRNVTGITVDYSYFDGFGYAVDSIDGVGNPVSSSAPPYWLYRVNGEDAQEGISTQPIVPGDVVEWRASNLGPPCE